MEEKKVEVLRNIRRMSRDHHCHSNHLDISIGKKKVRRAKTTQLHIAEKEGAVVGW